MLLKGLFRVMFMGTERYNIYALIPYILLYENKSVNLIIPTVILFSENLSVQCSLG